jgi:dolichol-phosphate mannosyltransferase
MTPLPTPSPAAAPAYSVVIPFFNEQGAVTELLAELREAMEKLGVPFEVILVDDGSTDDTRAKLSAIAAGWPAARCLPLGRNRGQAGALLGGFAEARAPWIITLDGDGQNSPADIPELITIAENGYDMVVGIRVTRRDNWLRRAMSRLANRVRGKILGDRLHDSGCALKVFRREIVASFSPIRSLYSFMPAFAVAAGWRITEIPVRHRERETGVSKYGFGTFAWRPLVDLLALWWLLRCRRVKAVTDADREQDQS